MRSADAVRTGTDSKVLNLVYIAIGAALIAICSWISIPTAVPFTLQTFAVFLTLMVLGGRMGTVSILLYICIGAAGVPVFAGFKGGLSVLVGPTGGYILGFLFCGLIYMAFGKLIKKGIVFEISALVLGLIVCYAFGTIWFIISMDIKEKVYSLGAALSACVMPFIIPDLLKLTAAVTIAKQLKRMGMIKKQV
jgi:biotin transport system substrate-specific component